MEERDKAAFRERHERFMKKHHRTRDEEKEIRERAQRRRAHREERAPRHRLWGDSLDEDELENFEPMGASRGAAGDKDERAGLASLRPVGEDELASCVQVVAVHRDRARLYDGREEFDGVCVEREAAAGLAVGDLVLAPRVDAAHARIEALAPRRSSLSRPDPADPRRERVLAANVDLAVLVASVQQPTFRPRLVDRVLIAVQRGGCRVLLALNKMDLADEAGLAALDGALAPYRELGVELQRVSAVTREGLDELADRLRGLTCVFVGHSGVGKSSLLNALDPDHERTTARGREHDGKGRHTTSASSLVVLADDTRVIDTPGIRAFGLWAVRRPDLRFEFPDFEPFADECRFDDCLHDHEPECGVRAAVEEGRLSRARFEAYARILGELPA